jgi:hypothetical protein
MTLTKIPIVPSSEAMTLNSRAGGEIGDSLEREGNIVRNHDPSSAADNVSRLDFLCNLACGCND